MDDQQRYAALRQFAHEILHWIYPMEGDPDHRAAEFVLEAMIGYLLLEEPNPFHHPEGLEATARSILALPAKKARKRPRSQDGQP